MCMWCFAMKALRGGVTKLTVKGRKPLNHEAGQV